MWLLLDGNVMKLMMIVYISLDILPSSASVPTYEFRQGRNASITFAQALDNSSSTVTCELFSLDRTSPFYVHGRINQMVLRPDQQDRFSVSVKNDRGNFTAIFNIREIQKNDVGVYILSLREISGRQMKDHILDAYVDVRTPPGRADCNVSATQYSRKWREVRCEVTVGDIRGGIVCFQNTERAPYKVLFSHSNPLKRMTAAVYWMNIDSQISCCSYEVSQEISSDSCTDFQYRYAGTVTLPGEMSESTSLGIATTKMVLPDENYTHQYHSLMTTSGYTFS